MPTTRPSRLRTLCAAASSFLLVIATASVPAIGQTANVAGAVPNRLNAPVNNAQMQTIHGTVHPLANAANDKGRVADSLALNRIQVLLQRSAAQEVALQQAIKDMHTPGTATYHQWLTPDQFGKQYGPSDADIATLSSWLTAQGFAVGKLNPGRQTLEISGTAGQFRNAFKTEIHQYSVKGQMHTSNSADPQIPAALAPVFAGFASLNNFPLKSYAHRMGSGTYNPATHTGTANWTEGLNNNLTLYVAPGDFAVQYDLNPLYAAGTKGAGQTIGIINEANINPALVAQYRSVFGLPASAPNIIIDGNDPGIDGNNNPGPNGPNGASVEAYLDVEMAGMVAPAATIDLIIAGDTPLENGLALAAQRAVYSNIAPVLSLSFGNCEAGLGTSNAFWLGLWEQAAAQGQTVMVSAGDNGSAGCDDDTTQSYATRGQQVNGLGSTPYNVSVGGTDFYYSSYNQSAANQTAQLKQYWNLTPSNSAPTTSLLTPIPEQPWNDSQYGLNLGNYFGANGATTIVAGSGGASNCGITSSTGACLSGYAKPRWQTGAGVPADGVRDVPDVSLFAANGENASTYPICAADGDCQPAAAGGEIQISGVGGTSASAPAFAGIMALVNQKYGRQGQANFILYPLATQFPAAFHDVTNGTNTVPCQVQVTTTQAGTPNCIAVTNPVVSGVTEGEIGNTTTQTADYNATAGYDLASGLGTIDANVLVSNWSNVKLAASSVTLNTSSTSFTHGTAVTISGAVTPGTATGVVDLLTTSTVPLNTVETAFTLTNGTYTGSINYLPGGTYTIYGAYSGDGVNAPSTSTPVQVTVAPEASSLYLVGINADRNLSIQSGATISYGTQVLLSGEAVPTTFYNACVLQNGSNCSTATYSTPTGTVAFADGTNSLNTAAVNVEGDAEYNAVFSVGTHSVTGKYSGDGSYNASSAGPIAFTVVKDTPQVYFASSAPTTALNPGVSTITVQLENSADANLQASTQHAYYTPAAAPTGVVTITGLPSGTLTLPALSSALDPNTLFYQGVATLALPTTAAGSYVITINYPGDANYNPVAASGTVTVAAATGIPTTTVVTSSATATSPTAAVTITSTVTGTTAGGTPTGTLQVYSSGVFLGTLALPASSGTSVTASFQVNSALLILGANQITVEYSGSTVYAPSFGLVNVQDNGGNTVSPGSVALSNSGPITIATPGGTGTATITATPSGGFTGNVALSCTVTPVQPLDTPTCNVSPTITVTGTGAATGTVTVATTAVVSEMQRPMLWRLPVGGGAVMAVLVCCLPLRRRRMRTLLGLLMLAGLGGFVSGCSSGSSGGHLTNPGTTPGTYSVVVTGAVNGATVASTTVTMTLQ